MTTQRPEDSAETLTAAVVQLTSVVEALRVLLTNEYPKRTEVERRFVTRLSNQRHTTRLIILALVTVIACYALTVGSYSACFVGETGTNPGICKIVPGYKDRVARSNEVDRIHQNQNLRIMRIEKRLHLKPIPLGGDGA